MSPSSSSSQYQPQRPIDLMLSQLSFSVEIPNDDDDECGALCSNAAGTSVWNGLLCLSFNEDSKDLFFDAQQEDCQLVLSSPQKNVIDDEQKEQDTTTSVEEEEEEEEEEEVESHFTPLPPPTPPSELPRRFLLAGKSDPEEGRRRYEATLQWRKEWCMDTILQEPHPYFKIIKKSYPHYFHLRSRNQQPVYYEKPPKTDLQAMKDAGVKMEGLLRHYAMVTEFEWNFLELDDNQKCITVIDLDGMRLRDFVGDCVDFVKRCFQFCGDHYPERAGFILVINTPFWFQSIWKILRPWIDPVTLQKIDLIRGKKEVLDALLKLIPIENIPPEYGGKSMPLGESPEEVSLRNLMEHNLNRSKGDKSCGGRGSQPPCQFCSFVPARSY